MSSDEPKSLDAEIEAAMDGLDLQEIGLPARRGGKQQPAKKEKDSESGLTSGQVVEVRGDDVFIELGPRMQGFVPAIEFDELPEVGTTIQVTLRNREEDGLWRLSFKDAQVLAAWNDLQVGSLVKARVTGQNTGGLELSIGSNKAFMPASQVDVSHVADLSTKIGETMVCSVLEIDRGKKRVVVSRRVVLEEERRKAREDAMGDLAVGAVVKGKVTRLESFGAFVDIGGVEGLVHVSNISRKRVNSAEEALQLGQDVEALVLEIKDGGKRIGLGLKQLEPSPWDQLPPHITEDGVVTGKVTRLMDFGAFVEIADGLEGLCHVSQMGLGGGRRRADEAVKVGEEISVRILSIERDRERLSLSMLDRRGARIGSEEAVDEDVLREAMGGDGSGQLGTSLGSLFKKALE